jgi:hypothetical protein
MGRIISNEHNLHGILETISNLLVLDAQNFGIGHQSHDMNIDSSAS